MKMETIKSSGNMANSTLCSLKDELNSRYYRAQDDYNLFHSLLGRVMEQGEQVVISEILESPGALYDLLAKARSNSKRVAEVSLSAAGVAREIKIKNIVNDA